MAIILSANDVERVHIPPRLYVGTLTGVRIQQFPDKFGEDPTKMKDHIIWAFAINRKGKEPVTVEAITSTAFGGKSKARVYAKALLNAEPPSKLDIEEMFGLMCQVKVEDKESDGETYSRIVDAFAIVPDEDEEEEAPKPAKPAAKREPARAPDGEELPY